MADSHGSFSIGNRRDWHAMARVSALPEAASRGYSVVHTWEKEAPLQEEVLNTLQKLGRTAGARPVPKHVRGERSTRIPSHSGSSDGSDERR